MGHCCRPGDFDDVFSDARASADARAYRRKGLDRSSRRLVDVLRARGIADWSVLEIGGGVGAIQLELLNAGASRATNVELSASYERVAHELIADAALGDRIERRIADFVTAAASVAPADAVVLHRVVCCYSHVDALVGAAARVTKRVLLVTVPVERWWIRSGSTVLNAAYALRRSRFRFHVHPLRAIRAAAEHSGLRAVSAEKGVLWQLLVFDRA